MLGGKGGKGVLLARGAKQPREAPVGAQREGSYKHVLLGRGGRHDDSGPRVNGVGGEVWFCCWEFGIYSPVLTYVYLKSNATSFISQYREVRICWRCS